MPCTNEGWPPTEEEIQDAKVPAAVLCALMRKAEDPAGNLTPFGVALANVLSDIDWAETGVDHPTFAAWWARHKMRDAQRRAKERQNRAEERLRQQALAKLTVEERRALLKDWKS